MVKENLFCFKQLYCTIQFIELSSVGSFVDARLRLSTPLKRLSGHMTAWVTCSVKAALTQQMRIVL